MNVLKHLAPASARLRRARAALAAALATPLATLVLATLVAPATHAQQSTSNMRLEPWPDDVVELAESLPIQDGGRIKPLHTYAGFTLLRMNGKRSVKTPTGERLTPVEWLLDVLFFPEAAATYPIFIVQNSEVIEAIGLSLEGKKRRDRYSFDELRPAIGRLFELAREYGAIEDKQRTSVQQQLYLLASNVNYFAQLLAFMDFAREPIPVARTGELPGIFDGAESVGFHDVVAHLGPLRERYQELAADHGQAGPDELGELDAIAGVLRTASALAEGTEALALIPPAADEEEAWRTPAELLFGAFAEGGPPAADVEALAGFERLAGLRNDPAAFTSELEQLNAHFIERATERGEYEKVGLELSYYKSKVLSYSHYAFVLAFLLMAFMWLRPRGRILYGLTWLSVSAGTVLLTAAIVMRCLIRSRPPVSTLYETVLFVTATGAFVALIMEAINRRKIAVSAAAVLGMVGLFIANGYEMLDKQDTMPSLVAVLDTNFWLATHVTSITFGYSAGMLAALLASVYLLAKPFRSRLDPGFFKSLGRMVYGALCFGLILSTVGTILGGIWANDSWGRFWGWDPKENGALLICISQIVILHARMGGYLREHGVCMAAAFGGTIIAFSWWGVNLLGVGLHSYGFTSGIARALWTYYTLQWGIVGLGGVTWLLQRGSAPSRPLREVSARPDPTDRPTDQPTDRIGGGMEGATA